MTDDALYIGIDAGATKTELLAQEARNERPFSLSGPPANVARLGVTESARILADLIKEALESKPSARLRAVCAGVAGAGSESDQRELEEEIRRQIRENAPESIRVVTDGDIALEAAFAGGSGIVVSVGTGSIVVARATDGTTHRAGGWGYLLGDEGSGYAIGLGGLRAVTRALDGGEPTVLQRYLKEEFGFETDRQIKHAVYRDHWALQNFAPFVFKAAQENDGPARQVVTEQVKALAEQVARITQRGLPIEKRIALIGGLANDAYYRKQLADALTTRLAGWQVMQSHHRSVLGALLLARRQHRT